LLVLFSLVLAESVRDDMWQTDEAPTGAGLWRLEAEASSRFLDAAFHSYGGCVEIERAPCQAAYLAAAHTRSKRQLDNASDRMPVEFGAKRGNLCRRQDLDFVALHSGRPDDMRSVTRNDFERDRSF
jgi:hypothetical protein